MIDRRNYLIGISTLVFAGCTEQTKSGRLEVTPNPLNESPETVAEFSNSSLSKIDVVVKAVSEAIDSNSKVVKEVQGETYTKINQALNSMTVDESGYTYVRQSETILGVTLITSTSM